MYIRDWPSGDQLEHRLKSYSKCARNDTCTVIDVCAYAARLASKVSIFLKVRLHAHVLSTFLLRMVALYGGRPHANPGMFMSGPYKSE